MFGQQSTQILAAWSLSFDKFQTVEHALPAVMLPDEFLPILTQRLPECRILQEAAHGFGEGCRLVGDQQMTPIFRP